MRLAPDDVLGDGRYQLLSACGGDERAGMEFWHARDLGRGRDVALTVLLGDPSDQVAVRSARQVLEGVRYADAIEHPALAYVLDLPPPGRVAAARDGVLGFVVAEWIEGVDLVDGVFGAHLPITTACRLLRPLVDAVDMGHHAGVVAGVDSPGRIRIGEHGAAVLAFRGTPPVSTTRDDVSALGAVLYLLLTGVWPMADSAGQLVDPTALRPEVPRDLALVAMLSLDTTQGPGIRTCGPLLRALDEMIAYEEPQPVYAEAAAAPPVRQVAPRRRSRPFAGSLFRGRRLAAGIGALVVAAAVLVGAQVAGALGTTTVAEAPVPPPVTTTRPPVTTTTTTKPPPPPAPAPIAPATVREYVVSGSEDNPHTLSRVIDGDPGTMWHTDTYRQQFPVYTPGIGIVAGFAKPVPLASVTIESPSAGTVVQIRAAASEDVSLNSPVLATATLTAGATTIPLPAHAASPYLLVWITHLDETADGFQSLIAEITCQPASA